MKPIDVFIAYAQQDNLFMERLRKQLSAAERIGLVDAWHDGEIEIGTDREAAAKKAMNEAEIIVLLLSADFFASEYLYEKEMAQALELSKAKKATIIPVLIKDCTWQLTPLAHLKVLPKNEIPVSNDHWENPDQAFKHIVDEIIRISNKIRKKQGIPVANYDPQPKEEAIPVDTTSNQGDTDDNKTPLWKLILYAFLGLGAFALVSNLVNWGFVDPTSNDTTEQEHSTSSRDETSTKEVASSTTSAKEQNTDEPTKGTPKVSPAFKTIQINNLEWSAQNMNVAIENSWCYDDASTCSKRGRLYNFEAANAVCPEGWRLPSKEEWLALSSEQIASLGLTKGGVYDRGSYRQAEMIGYYFTPERSGGGEAWVIEFRGNDRALQKDRRYVHWGMSCRCVR